MARFWFIGRPFGKFRRPNYQVDGEQFTLSLEERAGVRTVVKSNFFPQASSVGCIPAGDAARVPAIR
jgi:hypothetical protein